MSDETKQRIKDLLLNGIQIRTREEIETAYPSRQLPAGAEVMRVPPSPTGFVHIGTIYAGLINERLAHQTGGVFILRIEDTDKKREVEGSLAGIISAFKAFGLSYDEGPEKDGVYGPYLQSERADIYLTYALDLLDKGRAYPCFATSEELQTAVKDQQAKKLRPGYYGDWALWRDRDDSDVVGALDAGKPFVLRFKSLGSHDKRVEFDDLMKGHMVVPENDLDVPLIKSDEYRLPTYHLAHVVDDYLMRVTKVFRSDEWLPSTALHIELAHALGITPFNYGHFAPISIIDKNGGGKRKLSKRKDDEADVRFWLKAGYPVQGVEAYLLGLANSNFEDWYRANPGKALSEYVFSIDKLTASRAPLLDMGKLEDYCKDYFANMPQEQFEEELIEHTAKDTAFHDALVRDREYTSKILSIERTGDKPRKDIVTWSDAENLFGYFYDDVFKNMIKEELEGVSPEDINTACSAFMANYNHSSDKDSWFENMKKAAESTGYTLDRKALKENPEKYKGGISDFATIIRVKLTGKTRTPDLWTIMQVMGEPRVLRRLQ